MARTVAEINSYIVTNVVTQFADAGITLNPTLWSKRNIIRLLCYTFAIAQNLLEQLQDIFITRVEEIQARSSAASSLWLQDKMFKFQYDATTPQILQAVTVLLTSPTGVAYSYLALQYPIVDATKRIITACSIRTNISGQVKVKVAKGNPFTALTTPEVDAAQSYIDMIGAAGITYQIISLPADKLMIQANIYYLGSYSAVIQANVIAALNAFLQNASIQNFDGSIKLSLIEDAIQAVEGVTDIVFVNVRARRDADAYSAGTDIVLNQNVISRLWPTVAGYMVEETTAGKTFADMLNFIPE